MSNHFIKRCWMEINLDQLVDNIKEIKSTLYKETDLMAIVKADAYGHGSKVISKVLEENGVNFFGVSNINEALELRECGIKSDILVLGYTSYDDVKVLYDNNIIQTVYNLEYAEKLNEVCKSKGIKLNCHIKIDTGMNRLGFLYTDQIKESENILSVYNMSNLNIIGIFSHLSRADLIDRDSRLFTEGQSNKFNELIKFLEKNKVNVGLKHLQNSMGTINYRHFKYDFVRPGIIIYGLNSCYESNTDLDIQPIMEFKSVISMIKEIKKGSHVSYGDYTIDSDLKIATVSVGYADGYPRSLSNKGIVLVNGSPAKVIGNICMDQMMIDITSFNDVKIGDEVVLFGGSNQINNAIKVAKDFNLFSYELISGISKRVDRIYIKEGRIIK